jgi:hypothetical protein
VGRPRFQLVAPDPLEHELQIDCTNMLNIVLLPDVQWTAIDHAHSLNWNIGRNGKPIGLIEMVKRKNRGIRPGICDYLFWFDGRGFAIELKRSPDEKLSEDQKDFCKGLIRARIPLKICWLKSQVFNVVTDWGLTRPMRIAA